MKLPSQFNTSQQLSNCSYVNLLTTSISSNYSNAVKKVRGSVGAPQTRSAAPAAVKAPSPGGSITHNYYKQIEMSKAARDRRKHEQMKLQQKLSYSNISRDLHKRIDSKERIKMVDAKCMDHTNI